MPRFPLARCETLDGPFLLLPISTRLDATAILRMPEEDVDLMKSARPSTGELVEGWWHRLHRGGIASCLAKLLAIRCTISLVSSGPQLVRPPATTERNWLAVAVASAIMIAVVGALILFYEHGKGGPTVTPISATADPYAANLTIANLVMSESSNLSGGKVTYLDGHITNSGSRVVTGITVQVLFRDAAHEVAQNETQALRIIRTRDPYVDVEPLSAAPLKPGATDDFRLVFDTVADQWDGAFPDIRIIRVNTK